MGMGMFGAAQSDEEHDRRRARRPWTPLVDVCEGLMWKAQEAVRKRQEKRETARLFEQYKADNALKPMPTELSDLEKGILRGE